LATIDWIVSLLGNIALATLLTGLVLRGRLRRCVSFSVYVASVLLPSFLMLCWPERFYRWEFYSIQESVHALLKFAIALELTAKVFGRFPGANAVARRTILAVLSMTLFAVLALPSWRPAYEVVLGEIHPRILNGTTWLLAAITGLVLWYRIPIEAFQKAILLGLTPYLLVFTVGQNALRTFGWERSIPFGRAHTVGYLGVLLYWNVVAWARVEARDAAGRRPAAAPAPEAVRE
jgi:hypothetical protein